MQGINVVLSGSGTRYPIHVGALRALDEVFDIKSVCGVSGGAIVAATYATTQDIEETQRIVLETLPGPNGLIDDRCMIDFLWSKGKKGLIKGDKLLAKFEEIFAPTFRDTKIPLYVYATNLYRRGPKIWSSVSDFDYSVATAVRASMSYPVVFDPVIDGKEYYWDGGLLNNFPVDNYTHSPYPTVGVYISSQTSFVEIDSWKDTLTFMIDTILESFVQEDIEDTINGAVIKVPSKGKVFDFSIDTKKAMTLMNHGYYETSLRLP